MGGVSSISEPQSAVTFFHATETHFEFVQGVTLNLTLWWSGSRVEVPNEEIEAVIRLSIIRLACPSASELRSELRQRAGTVRNAHLKTTSRQRDCV